ncbi:MAG: zinc-ribbon domain containing protein [Dehalococcoidia bacterium]
MQNSNKDIKSVCADCGHPFIITVSEERFYISKGMPLPKRCSLCRAQRKATINTERGWRYG